MSKLLSYRYAIKQNLILLLGVCLSIYFAYHTLHGERSLIKLISLSSKIETLSLEADKIANQRAIAEHKVRMMRPGSINRDLLEERVRIVLGYSHSDDVAIMRN